MNIFSKITLCNLKKNRTRTLVTIIGILLSTAMFTAVSTTVSSLSQFMIDYTLYSAGGWYAGLYDLTVKEMETLDADPEVTELVYLQRLGFARMEDCTNEDKPYLCVEAIESNVTDLLPVHVTDGRMPENENELLLPNHLADNGGVQYALDDTLTLKLGERTSDGYILNNHDAYITPSDWEASSTDSYLDMGTEQLTYTSEETYTVVGFYSRPDFEDYIAPGYTALTITDSDSDTLSYDVYFKIRDGKNIRPFVDAQTFTNFYSLNYDLLRCYGYSGERTYNTVMYNLALILIGIIMFGSISLIYNAFSISVSERTQQFGVLASIGATRQQLRKSVLTEGLFLGIVGIPLGILSGILGMWGTFLVVGDALGELILSESPVRLTMHFSLSTLLVSALIALLTILISAWLPARRSLRYSAIETIRQSDDIRLSARQVKTSRLTQKLFGFEGMIASKNYKRNRKRYRATVVSLFISIVLFISASSFCAYLERSAATVYEDYDFNLRGAIYSGADYTLPDIDNIQTSLLALEDIHAVCYFYISSADIMINTDALTKEYLDMMENYYGVPQDRERAIDTMTIVFLEDSYFREYLQENGIEPSGYFIPNHPKAVIVDNISYYDSNENRYRTLSAFSSVKQAQISLILAYEKEGLEFNSWRQENGQYQWVYRTDEEEGKEILIPFDQGCEQIPIDCDTRLASYPSMCLSNNYTPSLYLPYSQAQYLFPASGSEYANFRTPFASGSYDFTIVCDNHAATYQSVSEYLDELSGTYYLTDIDAATENDRTVIFVIDVFSYGFIILISLISVANVFNTISTNIQLRSREFAMLRSVGLEPRGVMRMMNFECLLYGFKGLMYGLPTAVFITWLIYRAVSDGIEFRFYIPWYSLAIAIGSVFAVVFATMLYSMKKIRQENTVDALKNENI